MDSVEPILVRFVELRQIDWAMVLFLSGTVLAVISLLTAREYIKRHHLPQEKRPQGLQMRLDHALDLGPDPHASAVGRIFLKAAALGGIVAVSGFLWMLF